MRGFRAIICSSHDWRMAFAGMAHDCSAADNQQAPERSPPIFVIWPSFVCLRSNAASE
jgi:hypothetical protein